MQRRAVIALVTLSLLASAIAVALVTRLPGSERIPLSSSPDEASHVTLYQNGLAAVRLERTFNATEAESTLSFALPPAAIFDSVTLAGEGVRVKEIRSALAQTSGVRPGDAVVVHVEDQSYRGVVRAIENGKMALTTETGVTYVELSRVTAIEVEGIPTDASPVAPGSIEATARVTTTPGDHDVTLSYLVRGPGWTPTYRLDAETGNFTFFATLTASDDWRGVTLDIVAGAPHVVYSPSPQSVRYQEESLAVKSFAGAPNFDASFAPSAPLGDMHRYRYEGHIDLARGESARLVLVDGKVDILRTFNEARTSGGIIYAQGDHTDVTVLDRIEIKNTLPEPLPAGVIRAYRGGEWVGEDQLASTPVGATANVTLATSQEVKARLVLASHDATFASDTWTYTLTITNRLSGASAHPADLRVIMDYPTYRTTLKSTQPEGARVTGSSVTWDAVVPVGGSTTFTLVYETLKYG